MRQPPPFATTLAVRILLINYAAVAPKHGSNFRSNQLARLWVEMGHSVTIVGASYSHLLPAPVPFDGSILETEQDGVRYVLLKAPYYQGSGIKRALNIFACNAGMRIQQNKIIGSKGVDVVIAGSVYQIDNYPARRIARKYKAAFIRETRDLWPLTLTDLSNMSPRHPFAMFIQRAEDYGYRHADMVATTLPNSFGHMQSRGLDRERWIYMPQCPNPFQKEIEKEIPVEHARAFEEAKIARKFIVIFTGSVVLNADLETLLSAAKKLENENVQFFLIGRGPSETPLKEKAAQLGLKNLQFLPAVERGQIPPMLRMADVATVGFLDRPLYSHGISPNKVFEYMQNGLPIIVSCRTKGDPVSESGAGFVIAPENPDAITDTIRKLMRMSPEERKALGARGQEFVRARHDLRNVAVEYVRLFSELTGKKN